MKKMFELAGSVNPQPKPADATASSNTEKLHVGRELMDTTWRITVPVLLFAVVGIFIDKAVGSKPWVTLLGAMIGFLVATLLIKRQIMNGPAPTNKPASPEVQRLFDKDEEE